MIEIEEWEFILLVVGLPVLFYFIGLLVGTFEFRAKKRIKS